MTGINGNGPIIWILGNDPGAARCADCDYPLPASELIPGQPPLCFVHRAWRRFLGVLP